MRVNRLKFCLYGLEVVNINAIINKVVAYAFFDNMAYCSNCNLIFFLFVVP